MAVALTFDADLTPGMRERLRDGRVDSYANMAVVDILRRTGTPALAAIASAGVTVVDGMSSGGAGGRSVDAIVEQTVTGAEAGSIVVMHLNGGDAAQLTDEALPRIIDGIRARGPRFVRLSEMLSD